jgi:alpha-D-xyloside xylohydrolase
MKQLLNLLILLPFLFISCAQQGFKKLEDGIMVYPSDLKGDQAVRLQVISDKIIHVMAGIGEIAPDDSSLMIPEEPAVYKDWQLEKGESVLTIKTRSRAAEISRKTGEVVFRDSTGNIMLAEKQGGGKSLEPLDLEGQKYYTIRQEFESPEDEAFYGLGQHQHDRMNYKGKDVDLYQHNIVAVVPFLVSNKNYGILWENYSISKFGDPRDYGDINTLKLYGANGTEGGLSASYISRSDPAKVFLKQQEAVIDYEYLEDLPKLPKDFPLEKGKVIWEGSIEANETGIHKFYLYSAGYTKFWFNGELFLDVWRQGWNPWSHLFELDMKEGDKYPVKIEWIPDMGESFIAFKYKSPLDPDEQDRLSLWSEVANQIDYYFIAGEEMDEIIAGYRHLTGKSPIMPKWAMGKWQCRERYQTQQQLLDVVREFRKRHIPLDDIVQDWFYWPADKWGDHDFDSTRFPDPDGMIAELHEKLHARIMISVWPKLYEGTENYKYMSERGWVFTGNINNRQKDWVGYISTFYDAFNPEAREYFWSKMNEKLFSKHIDAWWMDATEPDILSNTSLPARKYLMSPLSIGPSARYFNAFSLVNSQAVYEGQREVSPDQRVFILTRSAYAGQQRYASATWSGDVASRWYDLKAQISAGLNFSLSGIPYWTTDIGGFAVERRYERPDAQDLKEWRELNTRWYQFGTFCPLFRVHGQFPYREIYNVAPEDHPAYQSMLYYDKLRYRLMPYIYTLAGMTWHEDYTIMRALVMDFLNDEIVRDIGDQFMFGPSLMVCPVYEYEFREREVYLPAGQGWYDFYTGKYYEGGQTIMADAPYERIPLYVKAGSIIPVGPEIEYTAQRKADEITLWVYQGQDADFSLYEDEGTNYNYEKGEYMLLPISYSEKGQELILKNKVGSYTGEPEVRQIRVVSVSRENPVGFDATLGSRITGNYSGGELVFDLKGSNY